MSESVTLASMSRPYKRVGILETAFIEDDRSPGGQWYRLTGRILMPWGESVTAHLTSDMEYSMRCDDGHWVLLSRTAPATDDEPPS